jgi:hypothetical protein
MTSHNGHAACKVRVAMDDAIYSDLPKREGTIVRLCFYYRGFLVWQEARREWAYSSAECQADEKGHRYYRCTGDRMCGTYADLFYTRRETLEAIDRRLARRNG